jgi:hypothetical protein
MIRFTCDSRDPALAGTLPIDNDVGEAGCHVKASPLSILGCDDNSALHVIQTKNSVGKLWNLALSRWDRGQQSVAHFYDLSILSFMLRSR